VDRLFPLVVRCFAVAEVIRSGEESPLGSLWDFVANRSSGTSGRSKPVRDWWQWAVGPLTRLEHRASNRLLLSASFFRSAPLLLKAWFDGTIAGRQGGRHAVAFELCSP